MGVDTRAVIVIGLPSGELPQQFSDVDEYGLESISPSYDAEIKYCIIGLPLYQTSDYHYKEISLDDIDKVSSLKTKFKKITGMDGKVYLSPLIW